MSTSVHPLSESKGRHALRAGFTVEDIFQLTKIDWFLTQMKEIVDFEEELAGTKAEPLR